MNRDSSCDLCKLETISKEYYRDKDFLILDCMHCKVPMVVPFEHIDPKASGYERLRERMEVELFRVAFSFYGNLKFFIDKQENKIPNHMHWHARLPRKKAPQS